MSRLPMSRLPMSRAPTPRPPSVLPAAAAGTGTAAGSAALLLIRHAATDDHGRLTGRSDPTIRVDHAAMRALAAAIGPVDRIAVSPAMRCRQTAAALWPDRDAVQDAALWEQDFGAWEGARYAHLPDLGPMPPAELAVTAPPGGESFAQACDRIVPALERLAQPGGRVAVVAHAGTVRAGLSRALGSAAAALAFRIAPLSLTELHPAPQGWAVGCVNLQAGQMEGRR